MKLRIVGIIAFAMICAGVVCAEPTTTAYPVNSNSKWYTVIGDGTSSSGCTVRAVASGQVVGTLDIGSKFLSFGSDAKVITLAYNGALAFIPIGAASELYPQSPTANQFRSGGKTLEEQAAEAKEKSNEAKGKPMKKGFTNQPTPTPQAGQGPGMPGGPDGGKGGGRGRGGPGGAV